jgi:hypothetical protein
MRGANWKESCTGGPATAVAADDKPRVSILVEKKGTRLRRLNLAFTKGHLLAAGAPNLSKLQ